jgi:multiple sugar transport system substrate-binding protein
MRATKTIVAAIAVAMVGTVAPLVTPASIASATSVTNITFWSWVPEIQENVTLFNKTHPGIHVTLVDAGSSLTEYTKLFAAIKAGKQPDVAQVEYEFLPEFLSQGALDNIAADVPAGFGKNFAPWAWSEVSSGSAVYSIPQDAGPMVMYYRSDLFAKYGLSVPTTWAEYASDAVTLHKDDPSLYITDFPQDVSPFLGLMWANGAAWFGTKGDSWTVDIAGTRSTSVASYWQDLLNQGLVKTDEDFSAAWYKDIVDSNVATILSASWANSQFPDNAPAESGDWRVALLPQWPGENSSGAWGGSTDPVIKGTPTADIADAATFSEWLNSNSASWNLLITKSGTYPSYEPALKNSYLTGPVKYYGNEVIGNVLAQANKDVNTAWKWGPTMSTVFTQWNDLLGAAINKTTTLPAGLDTLQGDTLDSLINSGFSVVKQG